jgi:hypothetical protein
MITTFLVGMLLSGTDLGRPFYIPAILFLYCILKYLALVRVGTWNSV